MKIQFRSVMQQFENGIGEKVILHFITLIKMDLIIDFHNCGYMDSVGGLGLIGITPKTFIFKREIEKITF